MADSIVRWSRSRLIFDQMNFITPHSGFLSFQTVWSWTHVGSASFRSMFRFRSHQPILDLHLAQFCSCSPLEVNQPETANQNLHRSMLRTSHAPRTLHNALSGTQKSDWSGLDYQAGRRECIAILSGIPTGVSSRDCWPGPGSEIWVRRSGHTLISPCELLIFSFLLFRFFLSCWKNEVGWRHNWFLTNGTRVLKGAGIQWVCVKKAFYRAAAELGEATQLLVFPWVRVYTSTLVYVCVCLGLGIFAVYVLVTRESQCLWRLNYSAIIC